jgi:hypothetical protein
MNRHLNSEEQECRAGHAEEKVLVREGQVKVVKEGEYG